MSPGVNTGKRVHDDFDPSVSLVGLSVSYRSGIDLGGLDSHVTAACGSGKLSTTGTTILAVMTVTVLSSGMVTLPPGGRAECAGTRSSDTSSAALLPSSTVTTACIVNVIIGRTRSTTGSIVPGRAGHV